MSEIKQNNNDFILLYNRDKFLDISQFMERNYIYGITAEEFFNLNKDLIWQQYSLSDKESYKNIHGKWPTSSSDLSVNDWLPSPCNLKINPSRVTRELAISQTNSQVTTNDFYAFANEKIQEIYQDEGFSLGNSSKRSLDCSVIGWFKSQYYLEKWQGINWRSSKKNTEFVSLSKYVISLSTSVTSNGGSFSIRLPIIRTIPSEENFVVEGEDEELQKIEINIGSKPTAHRDVENLFDSENHEMEYFSKASLNDVESNYFNWLISSNDILFISFEKLELEKGTVFGSFSLNSPISEEIFDMIGLVDDVKVITDAQSCSAYVEVTGRDLMKLLIEDGSFFFNNSVTSDPSAVFDNDQSYGKQGDIREADFMNGQYNNPINRIRLPMGEIDVFTNKMNTDLSYILKGVLSQLSNVEVVPGYVFDSWGEDRTKYVELKPEEK